jgi:hypothetical protein
MPKSETNWIDAGVALDPVCSGSGPHVRSPQNRIRSGDKAMASPSTASSAGTFAYTRQHRDLLDRAMPDQ